MSVVFMDPPANVSLRRGRALHEAVVAAIDNPGQWVVRAIRVDTKEEATRLHAAACGMRKNKTAKKNWQTKVARVSKNTFKALEYKDYGLRYTDIEADTVLALYIRVTDEAV